MSKGPEIDSLLENKRYWYEACLEARLERDTFRAEVNDRVGALRTAHDRIAELERRALDHVDDVADRDAHIAELEALLRETLKELENLGCQDCSYPDVLFLGRIEKTLDR